MASEARGLRLWYVHPQALPLRSYHFQKVGKKPELTLTWEPDDLEEEPTKQVSCPLCPPCFPKLFPAPVLP